MAVMNAALHAAASARNSLERLVLTLNAGQVILAARGVDTARITEGVQSMLSVLDADPRERETGREREGE